MPADPVLSDIRFEGYDNAALAREIDALRGGEGAESLNNAMRALVRIAVGLAHADQTLRERLREVGVTWQGEAADGGTSATEGAAIYAETAIDPVTESARGVGSQSETFHTTKNGAPEASTLRGPTEENGVDQFLGFLGHTTDHAKDVQATNAARDQAIDSMNGYQSNSSDALARSQALPVPPGMNLVAQPVEYGTTTAAVAVVNPSGGPGVAGSNLVPGGSSGALPPGGGTGGGLPPVPTTGGDPLTGGPRVGTGPVPGAGPLPTGPGSPLTPALRAANPLFMAEAATMMGAGSASGAGAGAERDRVARGGGGTPGAQAKGAVKGATPLGAAPDEEARAARNAERFGAKTGRPAGSIMQPAAAGGGRTADGEDDMEHVRRYGIDSGDVFDDDRVVAPESIGDDDDDR